MKFLSFLILSIFSINALAGTKIKKVDLVVEKPVIIRGSLDSDSIYYHMDTKGCLCWMSVFPDISYPLDIATFDCQKLKAYKAYEKAVEACYPKIEKQEPVSQVAAETVSPVAQSSEDATKSAIPEEKEVKVIPVESSGVDGPKPASSN
jgi:hypothetical protein